MMFFFSYMPTFGVYIDILGLYRNLGMIFLYINIYLGIHVYTYGIIKKGVS